MKQIILDTSFILTCVKQKIDFFEEIKLMGLQIAIPKQVIKEIERISELKKGASKNQSELALKLINQQKPRTINLKGKTTDKAIINYAKQHEDAVIATLDREIKKKIKNPKLIIRGKKKLESI